VVEFTVESESAVAGAGINGKPSRHTSRCSECITKFSPIPSISKSRLPSSCLDFHLEVRKKRNKKGQKGTQGVSQRVHEAVHESKLQVRN